MNPRKLYLLDTKVLIHKWPIRDYNHTYQTWIRLIQEKIPIMRKRKWTQSPAAHRETICNWYLPGKKIISRRWIATGFNNNIPKQTSYSDGAGQHKRNSPFSCSFCYFVLVFFVSLFMWNLNFYLFFKRKEEKNIKLGWYEGSEDLNRGKNIIQIYCMKISFN